MSGITQTLDPAFGSGVGNAADRGQRTPWQSPALRGVLMAAAAVGIVVLAIALFRSGAPAEWMKRMRSMPAPSQLQWLLALLPGIIIANHTIYLLSSRRRQFRNALAPTKESEELADLYFASTPLLARYLIPAIASTILCALVMTALTGPAVYTNWLWAAAGEPKTASGWPDAWGDEVLRGAAMGFVGAYVYLLLQLSDRARRHDITSGLAIWAAAMPALGPMMGGVAALLLRSGTGGEDPSFTQYAVFFVAGMLPQQFAGSVQSGVRKLFQQTTPAAVRTLPMTMLRGVGPEVEARLQEEGINDVSALAYASPYALIRATTYAPKQIADWIDEALLIATLPAHWDALEKVGVTGAMDLAWYAGRPESITVLAEELKMNERLLGNVIERLDLDAQVADLQKLYWDGQSKKPGDREESDGVKPPAGDTKADTGEGSAKTETRTETQVDGMK